MKEFAISFRRFKNNCKYVFPMYTKRKKKRCVKRMNMDWVKSQDHATYANCSESNCPVMKQCDEFEVR